MRDTTSLGRRLASDPSAVQDCYAAYGPMVLAYLRRYVPPGDAEDVMQQVFLDVWRSRERFDPGRRLEPWILDIAHKRAVDFLRRQSRTVDTAPESFAETAGAEFAGQHSDAMTVRDALVGLPPDQREALVLAYFGDLTQKQIAEKLGIPLGTVKARSFRGLRNLASSLVPDEDLGTDRDPVGKRGGGS